MKRLMTTAIVFAGLCAAGCGEKDLNRDLKPVDASAPRLKVAGGGNDGDRGDTSAKLPQK